MSDKDKIKDLQRVNNQLKQEIALKIPEIPF